jgi:hypothetical protein
LVSGGAVATPSRRSTGSPLGAPSTTNCTRPVAGAELTAERTVALRTTGWPVTDGLASELRLVVEAAGSFSSEKRAVALVPGTSATANHGPAIALARSGGAEAIPSRPVKAAALVAPSKVPAAPDSGTEKRTATPTAGMPRESVTLARRPVVNAPMISAACPLPATAVICVAWLPHDSCTCPS